jgi:hypothetical protein
MALERGTLRIEGLCGDKADHDPHWVKQAPVAMSGFWCHADQTKRMPYAGEQARKRVTS